MFICAHLNAFVQSSDIYMASVCHIVVFVVAEYFGLYKPRTGHTGRIGRTVQCENHAPTILADRCESTACQ